MFGKVEGAGHKVAMSCLQVVSWKSPGGTEPICLNFKTGLTFRKKRVPKCLMYFMNPSVMGCSLVLKTDNTVSLELFPVKHVHHTFISILFL
jgi:hypothetical protein